LSEIRCEMMSFVRRRLSMMKPSSSSIRFCTGAWPICTRRPLSSICPRGMLSYLLP